MLRATANCDAVRGDDLARGTVHPQERTGSDPENDANEYGADQWENG